MKDETNKVRYVYIHDRYMNRVNFLEEAFEALGIGDAFRSSGSLKSGNVPNLAFQLESTTDFEDWNVKLPSFKQALVGLYISSIYVKLHSFPDKLIIISFL